MKPLELYIHIPFCKSKCKYCDFISAAATVQEQERYVESLCRKIHSYGELAKAYQVVTVFIGGGTPSILTAEQMQRIFKAIYGVFSLSGDIEITVEVNPGTVTKEKLRTYKSIGVNRLSIGLQSASDEELKVLGRIHTFGDFGHTYQLVREEGFDNVNVDLISAIPHQTVASWKKTLHAAAALGPEHISAYSLILEEGTPFYEYYGSGAHDEELPTEEEERTMYEYTKDILSQYGYHRYEISNYAKQGYECRHNLGYWNRTSYLGIGTGAASLIENRRFVEGEPSWELTRSEQMEEFLFLGLRKTAGISRTRFEEQFAVGMEDIYKDVLDKLEGQQLISRQGDMLLLTDRGIDISNYVLSQFLL